LGLGFRAWGLGFKVLGFEYGFWGSGLGFQSLSIWVQGSVSRVSSLSLGFRVQD
jgi:hypothetical protein